jgi:acyl-CoA dehydrogenase
MPSSRSAPTLTTTTGWNTTKPKHTLMNCTLRSPKTAGSALHYPSIAESGAGLAGAQSIHANVYATQPVSKFATPEQRGRFLTKIISGEWRTCFGVTEPNTGLETLKLTTTAKKDGDDYSVTGQKIWISSAQVATKMVLLARTTPLEEVTKPSEGLSMFYVDFDLSQPGLEAKRIKKMGGRAVDANQVFFDNYKIPQDSLIGKEGQGFKIVR